MLRQVEQANAGLAKIEELKKELRETAKEKNTITQLYQQLKKAHIDLKDNLQKATKAAQVAEKINLSMAAKLEATKNSIITLTEEFKAQKSVLESELEACKLEVGDQYENRFNAALDQVHIIAPEIDTSQAYVWKEIIDG